MVVEDPTLGEDLCIIKKSKGTSPCPAKSFFKSRESRLGKTWREMSKKMSFSARREQLEGSVCLNFGIYYEAVIFLMFQVFY